MTATAMRCQPTERSLRDAINHPRRAGFNAYDEDFLFDPKAAGEYLGGTKPIAVQTLAIHRVKGTGPLYCKLGHLVRYRRGDLDAWVAARIRSSTSNTSAIRGVNAPAGV